MGIIPYESLTFRTRLSRNEVVEKLHGQVAQKEKSFVLFGFLRPKPTKPYEGIIDKDSFVITKVIHGQNSFLPVISGQIQDAASGTLIRVKMRLHIFVYVFMFVWLSGVGTACVAILMNVNRTGKFEPAFSIPFVMLLFGLLLPIIPFKLQTAKSKRFLSELFEADNEWT